MRGTRRRDVYRYGSWFTLTCAVLLASGCSSSGSDSSTVINPPIVASIAESGTASAADLVRITGSAAGDLLTIQVVLTGPTFSSDIFGFAFDLVLGDPTFAEYVPGSAAMGTALTMGPGQQVEVLAAQNGARITVGVTKLGPGGGNGVGATEETILSLDLRIVQRGTATLAIEGSPPNDASAFDSFGGVIGEVVFDAAPALLTGM